VITRKYLHKIKRNWLESRWKVRGGGRIVNF